MSCGFVAGILVSLALGKERRCPRKFGLGVDGELSFSDSPKVGKGLDLKNCPGPTLHLQMKRLRPWETVLPKITKLKSGIA